MSVMEEFLGLQEKLAKLEKKLEQKEAELSEKDSKLLELTEKNNTFNNELMKNSGDLKVQRHMVSVLETDKKNLERERDHLAKEYDTSNSQLKQFANIIETINKTLESKEIMLLSKEQQLLSKEQQVIAKDQQLVEKEAKIEEYRNDVTKIAEEKEQYQKEKFEYMEKLNKEKSDLLEKVSHLEKTVQADEQTIKKLKEKSKAAQDGLLGMTMELEQQKEKMEKLSAQLIDANNELDKIKGTHGFTSGEIEKQKKKTQEPVQKIPSSSGSETKSPKPSVNVDEEDLFAKGTGTYNSLSALIAHFKFKIPNANRVLRLIIPELSDIIKYELFECLNDLPSTVLKNIACVINSTKDATLIEELKIRNFKLTDYQAESLCPIYALTIDNNETALAVHERTSDSLTGIFTNNEELIKLLSQAVMQPFIRGQKVN